MKRQGLVKAKYVLTDYVNEAMALAAYDKLEDGTFAGKISACPGVVAFGATLKQCEAELRSTLEDWIWSASTGTQAARNRRH